MRAVTFSQTASGLAPLLRRLADTGGRFADHGKDTA